MRSPQNNKWPTLSYVALRNGYASGFNPSYETTLTDQTHRP
ncbi:MAG: hypothetical protein WA783_03175 [Phormidesmis sp.]